MINDTSRQALALALNAFQVRDLASLTSTKAPADVKRRPPIKPLSCQGELRIPYTYFKKNATTGESIINQQLVFFSSRWGNVLSPYWAARAMAELGGYAFKGVLFGKGSWMEYLPRTAPAREPRPDRFHLTCDNCDSYENFHRCVHGWGAIRLTVIRDTRTAIQTFFKENPSETLMRFAPADWIVYERCCVFCNMIQGFSNVRAYDVLPATGSFTVYTMSPPRIDKTEGHNFCAEIEELRDEYIRQRNPNIRLMSLRGGSVFNDFAKLVYVPNLLVPGLGTTFGLWAAMANAGNVHMGKPNTNDVAMPYNDPMYPPDLHILNAPWLGPRTAFDELHLNKSIIEKDRDAYRNKMRDSPEGVNLMKAWFVGNKTLPTYNPQ